MIHWLDHGYYAIKTKNFSFPAGVTAYTHEPYTLKNTLQIGGKYYVWRHRAGSRFCSDKTVNDNYYILTLAAIAMELRCRGLPAESSVTLAAGLPLARYGRDKKPFTEYLLRNGRRQLPVRRGTLQSQDRKREIVPPGIFRHRYSSRAGEG